MLWLHSPGGGEKMTVQADQTLCKVLKSTDSEQNQNSVSDSSYSIESIGSNVKH